MARRRRFERTLRAASLLIFLSALGPLAALAADESDAGVRSAASDASVVSAASDAGVLSAPDASAPEVVTPPALRCATPPEYPSEELAARRTDKVVLRVSIDAAGQVSGVAIVAALSPAFSAAAESSIRRCAFTPAKRGDKPAPAVIEVAIVFAPPQENSAAQAGDAGPTDDASAENSDELPDASTPGLTAWVVGDRLLPKLPKPDPTPVVGHYEVTRADLDRTPGAMEDITRVVANLPGIVADPDLLATLFVRGGGPDELIEYLDEVPLENPYHLGGFASIFNPILIDSADVSIGVSPARYDPSLSGALDVHYITGETDHLHAEADLSIQSAKALVDTPTGIDGLSVLLSARRTFFELYFAGLRAAGVVGSNYVAPELTEYFGRLNYKRGRHRISFTYLRASDGFAVLAAQSGSDSALFGFDGGVNLSNVLQLGELQDVIDLGEKRELKLTAAFTRDDNDTSVSGDTVFNSNVIRFEALARADLTVPFSEANRLKLGFQMRRQSYNFSGQISDDRGEAPWAALPLVTTGEPTLLVDPRIYRTVAALYGEELWKPWDKLALEAGGRFESNTGAHALYSVRVAASLQMPTASVLKFETGIATQQVNDPLLLDRAYGNPALLPERSKQILAGLEQPLPFRALLRVEGYAKWLDNLVVNPDTDAGVNALLAAGQPVFQNGGTGTARGVDMLLLGRTDRFSYGLSSGLLFAERTNPLASIVKTYPAPWDQRFTISANGSATFSDSWLVSARATFHTGRPTTAVLSFERNDSTQSYTPVFGPTNGLRYPDYFDASIRVEKRFEMWGMKLAWYFEMLNVTNAQNVFLYVYSSGNYAAGTPPTLGTFDHLPIRPFFGIRGEY